MDWIPYWSFESFTAPEVQVLVYEIAQATHADEGNLQLIINAGTY